jgi:hypothetical protein
VKVGISSADLPDSVLAHEDGCMRVVEQIAREVRNFSDNLLRDHRMLWRRYQNVEAWRGKQCLNKVPGLRYVPRSSHHPRVGCNTQEPIQDRPGRVPGIRAYSLALQPATAAGMERRIGVGGLYQNVRVYKEH